MDKVTQSQVCLNSAPVLFCFVFNDLLYNLSKLSGFCVTQGMTAGIEGTGNSQPREAKTLQGWELWLKIPESCPTGREGRFVLSCPSAELALI